MNATETASPRQRKPRVKPERRIRLCVKPDGKAAGVVRITVGKEQADYFLTEMATDFGGFLVEKIDPTAEQSRYHVNLEGDKRTCECKGFARWSHCRHADGLAALVAADRL